MKVIYSKEFFRVYSPDPAASAGRMESIVEAIESDAEFIDALPADEEDIAAVHDRRHIDYVRQAGLYSIAALAAGGTIQAAISGMHEPSFALVRPPGHHASAASCWGFCYFNNMAVALQHLKQNGKINSAYVLDIDLHYGDGTVNILGGHKDVTVHNVSASDRNTYLQEIADAMQNCDADLIGISAGFDNHADDWGGLLLTDDYQDIGEMVKQAASRSGAGCFAVLEGGYNHAVLGRSVRALLNGLSPA
jgi:acetoin utilization deacetylase AcuC-like enzyme